MYIQMNMYANYVHVNKCIYIITVFCSLMWTFIIAILSEYFCKQSFRYYNYRLSLLMSDPGTVHFSQSSPEHNQLNKLNSNVLKLLSNNGTTITPYGPNIPDVEISEPICQAILYDDISYSRYMNKFITSFRLKL